MALAYYNEIDPYAAQWLRNLIDAGQIAPGVVDTRSIVDVRPSDLDGFTQCHFFAGIGGWSLAARLAGWPDDRPLWSGSAPCQPFSVAGKGKAQADDRHLWPYMFRLVSACRPAAFVGEQVAAAVGKDWLDGVFADLEGIDYACGAAVVPACAVDAPHRRDRLWFVAHAECPRSGCEVDCREAGRAEAQRSSGWIGRPGDGLVGHTDQPGASEEREQRGGERRGADGDPQARVGDVAHGECVGIRGEGSREAYRAPCGMQGADGEREWVRPDAGSVRLPGSAQRGAVPDAAGKRERESHDQDPALATGRSARPLPVLGSHWDGAGWIIGHDGKGRRVKPGIRLLAHGVPARVGRLRAYGNAIVPKVASEVIGALMDCMPSDVRSAA